ncbi:MAG: hypothetical protein EOO90_24055 [Pedobacter sp.]|nr:MAG: hypothetical protein EOO90_24055 [Pedobacter sp.]
MMNLTLKKLTLILVLVGLGVSASFAQTYSKGDNLLNVGVGVGGGFGTPMGISFEHGFTDKISGGAYAAYASKTTPTGFGDFKYTYILTAARASYHFDFGVENLDPYLGVILGYNIASAKWNGTGAMPASSAGGVIYGGHAGARYFFSEKIGVFGEAGYGVGNLNIGLTFKL